MYRRFLLLAGLCVLLSLATRAFGAEERQAPWITREGAVAVLVASEPAWRDEVEQMRQNMPPMPLFDDTDQREWYAPYLEVAFAHGLIEATDFHRSFRPGELLRQNEAAALAVRYAARDDRSTLPQEEPDHPLALQLHVQAAFDKGLDLPESFEAWNVIGRADWNALIASAGVQNPGAIAVVVPERIVPAVVHVMEPLPTLARVGSTTSTTNNVVPAPAVTNPSYGTPPNARPISSDDPVPTQAVAQPTVTPTYVANPPNARPVSSDTTAAAPQPTPSATTVAATTTVDAADSRFTVSIPSLGIDRLTVTHPANPATQEGLLAPLKYGVGHLFSYPGQGGKVLIYGHSSSYSWDVSQYTKIFRQINKLNPGDRVTVTYGGKTYTYEVTYKHAVDATDMSAYQGGSSEELILYTCWPPDDIKQRYLVHAKPV